MYRLCIYHDCPRYRRCTFAKVETLHRCLQCHTSPASLHKDRSCRWRASEAPYSGCNRLPFVFPLAERSERTSIQSQGMLTGAQIPIVSCLVSPDLQFCWFADGITAIFLAPPCFPPTVFQLHGIGAAVLICLEPTPFGAIAITC